MFLNFISKPSAREEVLKEEVIEAEETSLTLSLSKNGETKVDLVMSDVSEEELEKLAELLAKMSTLDFQLGILDCIGGLFDEAEQKNKYEELLALYLKKVEETVSVQEFGEPIQEELCVRPSEVLQ